MKNLRKLVDNVPQHVANVTCKYTFFDGKTYIADFCPTELYETNGRCYAFLYGSLIEMEVIEGDKSAILKTTPRNKS